MRHDDLTVASGLACRDVTVHFGDRGLRDVSLTVRRGEIYALIGGNGAGKTTMINVCLGFLTPQAGAVTLGGIDALAFPTEAKRRLAWVPEVVKLYPQLTAIQTLAFFDNLAGGQADEQTFIDALDQMRFPRHAIHQPAATYSKGMRQKIVLAMGILKNADVFLLDEPTSGLDPQSNAEFGRTLQALRATGKAVLLASHDLPNVYATADRIGLLDAGVMIDEGNADDFRRRHPHDH
jgi:ABC-2 type transport system ATP-binding protein